MLTSLRAAFFLPDSEQFELGARWVRCDAYASASADDARLTELPETLEGALDNARLRAELGICSRVSPERATFRHIICTRDHHWRAISRLRLGSVDAAYPGGPQLRRTGSHRCKDVARDYLDARDGFSYGFEVPRRKAWAGGDRFGLCWAQTTD